MVGPRIHLFCGGFCFSQAASDVVLTGIIGSLFPLTLDLSSLAQSNMEPKKAPKKAVFSLLELF